MIWLKRIWKRLSGSSRIAGWRNLCGIRMQRRRCCYYPVCICISRIGIIALIMLLGWLTLMGEDCGIWRNIGREHSWTRRIRRFCILTGIDRHCVVMVARRLFRVFMNRRPGRWLTGFLPICWEHFWLEICVLASTWKWCPAQVFRRSGWMRSRIWGRSLIGYQKLI